MRFTPEECANYAVAASRRRSAWSSSRPCIRRVSSRKNSPRFHGGSTRQRSCTRLRSSSVNCSIASFPCARGALYHRVRFGICRILTVHRASWGPHGPSIPCCIFTCYAIGLAGWGGRIRRGIWGAGFTAVVPCGEGRLCTHLLKSERSWLDNLRCKARLRPCPRTRRVHRSCDLCARAQAAPKCHCRSHVSGRVGQTGAAEFEPLHKNLCPAVTAVAPCREGRTCTRLPECGARSAATIAPPHEAVGPIGHNS